MPTSSPTILVTGATGFVGSRLCEILERTNAHVIGATRDVQRAQARWPRRTWRALDVDEDSGIREALQGVDVVFYLVHGMADHQDYEEREQESAIRFRQAAAAAGVSRIIYLGGVAPKGTPSPHLRSRLNTGKILREGTVPCVELRAAMIVGEGSASWAMVRDLSARLPVMVLPRWLRSRSQPVSIDDVVTALVAAVDIPLSQSAVYALDGPQTMSAKEILLRVSSLRGIHPFTVDVPVISPKLSSYWIRFVTRANSVASELVEGLRSDLVAQQESFWPAHLPHHTLQAFDDAAKKAMEAEDASLSKTAKWVERSAVWVGRRLGREAGALLFLVVSALWAVAHAFAFWPTVYGRLFGAAIITFALFPRRAQSLAPTVRNLNAGVSVGGLTIAATWFALKWGLSHWDFLREQLEQVYAHHGMHRPTIQLPLTLVIVAGEEWLWREHGPRQLQKLMPPLAAMGLSTLIYGVVQVAMGYWVVMLAGLVMGTVWMWLRAHTGGLIAPFVAHIMWSLWVLLVPMV